MWAFANDDAYLPREIRACFSRLADGSVDLGWHTGDEEEKNGKTQVALWSIVHGYSQLVTAERFKKDNMKALSILDILPKIESESGR